MGYEQALEKAILEHAAYVAAHPKTKGNGTTKIPGFPDQHVWGLAMRLSEQGLLSASTSGDGGAVHIDEISDAGAERLQALLDAEEARTAERRQAAREAAERAEANRSWLSKVFRRK